MGVNVKMTDANDGVVYIDTKRTKRPIAFTYERRPLIPPVCPALEELCVRCDAAAFESSPQNPKMYLAIAALF